MIKVSRIKYDNSNNVIEPSDDWQKESLNLTLKDILIYINANSSGNLSNLKLDVKDHYKTIEIKQKLEFIFNGKCAYCELRFLGIHFDIDHFYPKKSVEKDSAIDPADNFGYFWLTYEWDNLFPSCAECNRTFSELDLFNQSNGIKKNYGKKNQFPLQIPQNRYSINNFLNNDANFEEPLLINPCYEDPENHLIYFPNGDIAPRNGSQKGKTTIEIFGLQSRSRLVQERAQIISLFVSALNLAINLHNSPDKNNFNLALIIIKYLSGEKAMFRGMIKYILKNHIFFGISFRSNPKLKNEIYKNLLF